MGRWAWVARDGSATGLVDPPRAARARRPPRADRRRCRCSRARPRSRPAAATGASAPCARSSLRAVSGAALRAAPLDGAGRAAARRGRAALPPRRPVVPSFFTASPRGAPGPSRSGSLLAYAAYRLAIAAAHRTIARAGVDAARVGSPRGTSDKVLRSRAPRRPLRARVTVFLVLSEAVLGRGYLYHVASRFAWLGAVPIAAALVRWWRDDISESLPEPLRQAGILARAVHGRRAHWYGFFVAVAAFVVVLVGVRRAAARGASCSASSSRARRSRTSSGGASSGTRSSRSAAPDVAALPVEVRDRLSTATRRGRAVRARPLPGDRALRARAPAWEAARDRRRRCSWSAGPASARPRGSTRRRRAPGDMPTVRGSSSPRASSRRTRSSRGSPARLGAPRRRGRAALCEALRAGPRRLVDPRRRAEPLPARRRHARAPGTRSTELIASVGDRVFWLAPSRTTRTSTSPGRGGPGRVPRRGADPGAGSSARWRTCSSAARAATGWSPCTRISWSTARGRRGREPGSSARRRSTSASSGTTRRDRPPWRSTAGPARSCRTGASACACGSSGGRRGGPAGAARRGRAGSCSRRVVWHESISADEADGALRYPRYACEDALRTARRRGVLRGRRPLPRHRGVVARRRRATSGASTSSRPEAMGPGRRPGPERRRHDPGLRADHRADRRADRHVVPVRLLTGVLWPARRPLHRTGACPEPDRDAGPLRASTWRASRSRPGSPSASRRRSSWRSPAPRRSPSASR